jgi:hypothetical protein
MLKRGAIRPTTWPLLPLPDANGQLSFPSMEDSVRQMIRVLLCTRPGEQLMRPEFGAGLDRFLHEPNTVETRRRVRDLVATAIATWEPRIVVEGVEVEEVADRPAELRVEIAYRMKRTGSAQRLGLLMEVGG